MLSNSARRSHESRDEFRDDFLRGPGTVLAFDRDRLWGLHRRLDDLDEALSRVQRSARLDTRFSGTTADFAALDDARRTCDIHRDRIRSVLGSEILNEWVAALQPQSRLRSWVETHPSWWAKATQGRSTDVDLVLRSVRHDPQAAAALADDPEFTALLVYGTRDTDAVRTFWSSVTDPATTPAAIAGRRIRTLLSTVFGDHPWRRNPSRSSIDPTERRRIESAARHMLGAVIAPWQFAFSGRAALWGWTPEEGISWLHRIAQSERSAADLARGLGPAVVASLSALPDSAVDRRRIIDDVAIGIGASLQVLHDAGIADAGRDRSSWRTFDQLLEIVPVDAPWPASILLDRGAGWLDDRLAQPPTRLGRDASLTGHQVLAGLAVFTLWRSYWGRPERIRDPLSQDRELRHAYDAIDAPSVRGRIIADRS